MVLHGRDSERVRTTAGDLVILTIDPGTARASGGTTGLAITDPGGNTLWLHLARIRTKPHAEYLGPDLPWLEALATEVVQRVAASGYGARVDRIGVEWQEVWQRPGRGGKTQGKQNPNDLIPLAFLNGLILGKLSTADWLSTTIETVKPGVWTNGVPKDIRQKNFVDKLNASDKALHDAILPASLRHNVVDAMHMGKWFAARPRRT